jgi:RHS repeat-associated protein
MQKACFYRRFDMCNHLLFIISRALLNGIFCTIVAILIGEGATCRAQGSTPSRGFQPVGSYALSEMEKLNTVSGNLMFNVPIAALPPGRGGSKGAEVGLFYNSKLFDANTIIRPHPIPGGGLIELSELIKSDEGGWRYGLEYKLELDNRASHYEGGTMPPCPSYMQTERYKLKMSFPDGNEIEFRPVGYNDTGNDGYFKLYPNGFVLNCGTSSWNYGPLTYYSTDGTYLRLVIEHDNEVDDWDNNPWTLYFPDGGRVAFNEPGSLGQRIYDRNNNFTEARSITYNGHPAHNIIDQLGRSIIVEYNSGVNTDAIHATGYGAAALAWTVLWVNTYTSKTYSQGPGYTSALTPSHRVVQQINMPSQAGALSYSFGYNGSSAQPVYPAQSPGYGELSSVTLPSSANAVYTYFYDGQDNLNAPDVLNNRPIGKTLTYEREYDGGVSNATEVWAYSLAGSGSCGGLLACSKVQSPDGGVSTEYHTNSTSWDRSLVYKSDRPDGPLVERIWQQNIPYGFPSSYPSAVNPHVKTEFTTIKNSGGTPVKTAIKNYNYDKNGNLTQTIEYDWVSFASIPRSGDIYNRPTGIPGGLTPKRVTVNAYYSPTPDASDTSTDDPDVYHKSSSPNLRNAIESSEIRSDIGASTALSRKEYVYDSPTTTGNLITERNWDNYKDPHLVGTPRAVTRPLMSANSISMSYQYDGYGNRILTTDANGVQAQFIYDLINGNSDLYVTQTKTAYNTSVQRISSQQYDFSTGLVTQSTDVDNSITTKTSYDVFGRPTLVQEAFGASNERRTATDYSDSARRIITRSDLNATGDNKLVSIKYYDQLGRIRLNRTLEDSSTQDAYNEEHGIKVQTRYAFSGSNSYELVSAPYRAATSSATGGEAEMAWKRLKFDRGGRVIEAQSFAGATLPGPWGGNTTSTGSIVTSFDAEFTTVTDQTERSRRTMLDGLNRLARVDEPDKISGNLGDVLSPVQSTSYSYDAIGKLTGVNQGAQNRTYAYSSLGRLISATNPENGAFSYTYDSNGNLKTKIDARSATATYYYDALNRNTGISYSGSSTPVIERYYDGALKGKGRLWKSYSYNAHPVSGQLAYSISTIDSYDEFGRPLTGSQMLLNSSVQWITYPFSRTYDRAGNTTTQTYPSGRTATSSYDNAGRLASLISNIGDGALRTLADSFTYNASGQIKRERYGTSTSLYHNIHYNSRGQAVDVRLGTNSTDEWSWNRGALITYFSNQARSIGDHFLNAPDNNGNVTMQEHFVPVDDAISNFVITDRGIYDYDYLNRVTQVSGLQRTTAGAFISVYGQGFNYDRWGNRTINSNPSATWGNAINNTVFTVNSANNRYVELGYDLAGNVISDPNGAGTLTYDGENRMTSTLMNGVYNFYVYDADGRRVRRIVGSDEKWHIYGFNGELIAEYPVNTGPGSPSKEYAYRNGQLLVSGDSNNVRWTMTDALGTPRIVVGKTGGLSDVTRHDYLPFGEELFVGSGNSSIRSTTMGHSTGSNIDGVRKQFTGYERDTESGLDFAQARYYSGKQGRFMSPDEFTGGPDELYDFADVAGDNPTLYAEIEDPQSLNKYQYCYNNPLSSVDPDGHSVWTKVIKIAVKAAKTGDAVVAIKETFEDVQTVFDSNKSASERLIAGLSVLSEVLPLSISDVKDGYKVAKAVAGQIDQLSGNGAIFAVASSTGKRTFSRSPIGTYINTHASGKEYIGVGKYPRSQESARRVAKEHNDPHKRTNFKPAVNKREAFKEESRQIDLRGGINSPRIYNRIESPGRRYRQEDGEIP